MLKFSKYHGAGNDFILIDNRKGEINLSCNEIAFLCNRHLGIGADGLMFLNFNSLHDFEMQYFNSDGNESTMCGNGGRCITAFASALGIIEKTTIFNAIDGLHTAEIVEDKAKMRKTIRLQMSDVMLIQQSENYFLLNTGSPHYVQLVDNVDDIDIVSEGRKIRYDKRFAPSGLNVNFMQVKESHLYVRTYERGVEDETLSCGTGVTASALAYASDKNITEVSVLTKGGNLKVLFEKHGDSFKNIFLEGETCFVFEGELEF
ncbi:MAG: diaminopimelate epimerase [Bacteroidetes bacterium]|nr:diaminopimelate epimerase [Bacteroidota bacterium]